MALTTPLADDAAIFEYSYTTGNTGVYQLAGAWGGFFTFKSEWPAGAPSIPIRVTDGSANTEISNAAYDAGANTLTVIGAPITSTNAGALVNWSGRTRLLLHALVSAGGGGGSITLCATTPWDGADLVWNGANNDWCPDSVIFGMPGATNLPQRGNLGYPSRASSSDVTLTAADKSASGDAGNVNISGGWSSTTPGGNINLIAGTGDPALTSPGPNGNIYLQSGGADTPGFITISGEYSATQSGDIDIVAGGAVTGSNVRGGGVFISSGPGDGPQHGGAVEVFSGGPALSGQPNGFSGPVDIGSGSAGGNQSTGSVSFGSGATDNGVGTTGVAGNTTIYGGFGGTGGSILLQPGLGNGTPGQDGAILIGQNNITYSPPTPPVGVYALYIDGAGNLAVKGSSGTVTTLAVP
jgi:hypothetical protein